ncbi:MAG: class I SAM-dependent methyltransferase [Firmicutes bacterium]|nr:class I SAM-dependent methyltransferase [Bacillota bacterium]
MIKSKRIADIGTDHAKLPIWLAKNNIIDYAIASDISIFSVKKSMKNVEKYKLVDKIDVRFSDGLNEIKEKEIDTIIISGLGGEKILKILKNCSWKNIKDKHFILQPNSSETKLRLFLADNGYEIESEEIVNCNFHTYTTISAKFTNTVYERSLIYKFLGKILPEEKSIKYVKKHMRNLKNKLTGAILDNKHEYADYLEKIMSEMNEFLKTCFKK